MKRLAWAVAPFLLACAPPTAQPDAGAQSDAGRAPLINPDAGSGTDGGGGPPAVGCPENEPSLEHEALGDDVTRTVVAACHDDRWVYLHLGSGEVVEPDDDAQSLAWDLAFRRFHVKSNGGVSGIGGVRVAPLDGVAFDDVTEPPAEGWLEDAEDSDLDGHDDYVISGRPGESWFQYNIDTHVLEVADTVWVVETVEGAHFKLLFTDYYREIDGNEEAGFPTFLWAPLLGASPVDAGPDDMDAGGDAG